MATPKLVFESDDRNAAHEELDRVKRKHPAAECREDSDADQPYQVWTGPDPATR